MDTYGAMAPSSDVGECHGTAAVPLETQHLSSHTNPTMGFVSVKTEPLVEGAAFCSTSALPVRIESLDDDAAVKEEAAEKPDEKAPLRPIGVEYPSQRAKSSHRRRRSARQCPGAMDCPAGRLIRPYDRADPPPRPDCPSDPTLPLPCPAHSWMDAHSFLSGMLEVGRCVERAAYSLPLHPADEKEVYAPLVNGPAPADDVLHLVLGDSHLSGVASSDVFNCATGGNTWTRQSRRLEGDILRWEAACAQQGRRMGDITIWLGSNDAYPRTACHEVLAMTTVGRVLDVLRERYPLAAIAVLGALPRVDDLLYMGGPLPSGCTKAFVQDRAVKDVVDAGGPRCRFIALCGSICVNTTVVGHGRRQAFIEKSYLNFMKQDGVHLSRPGRARICGRLLGQMHARWTPFWKQFEVTPSVDTFCKEDETDWKEPTADL